MGLRSGDGVFSDLAVKPVLKAKPGRVENTALLAKYELIHVYENGVYPDYIPDSAGQPNDTIFRDNTFDDVLSIQGVSDRVVYKSTFDEAKFLDIANHAVSWFESNIELKIDLDAVTHIADEFVRVKVTLESSPLESTGQYSIYVDESLIHAPKVSSRTRSRIEKEATYQVGVPSGKHRVKVVYQAATGQVVSSWINVNNKFVAKPALHLVAIGVDEFPSLGKSASLRGAVNDAKLLKKIFRESASSLFEGRVNIFPYSLSPEQTTSQN